MAPQYQDERPRERTAPQDQDNRPRDRMAPQYQDERPRERMTPQDQDDRASDRMAPRDDDRPRERLAPREDDDRPRDRVAPRDDDDRQRDRMALRDEDRSRDRSVSRYDDDMIRERTDDDDRPVHHRSRIAELRREIAEVYVRGDKPFVDVLGASSRTIVLLRPHNEAEVQAAVRWCAKNSLSLSVSSTLAQPWTLEGNVLVDMGYLTKVRVEKKEDTITLHVQGGATWADVYAAADSADVNVNGGAVSESVAETVSSGGVSWWGYRHGLVADSVIGANIVLPNGDVAMAGPQMADGGGGPAVSEADILWTLRGGFPAGIVTSFRIRAHPAQSFVMGRIQCPPDIQRWAEVMVKAQDRTAEGATLQLKVSGLLYVHFVADGPEGLRPFVDIAAEYIDNNCAVIDLEGRRSYSGSIGMTISGDRRFRRKRLSDIVLYYADHFPSFQGESRGSLMSSANLPSVISPVVQVVGAAHLAPRVVSFEMWPVHPKALDSVGHAFPHSENLLVTVRCAVAGVCPQLWMDLDPVTKGLYSQASTAVVPGDSFRTYGPTYRASQCLLATLAPRGARLLQGHTAHHTPDQADQVAQTAQGMLSCPAPFLTFDPCSVQHSGIVLVTGGSSGLGLVAVTMLVQQGLTVIIASRNQVKCEKAAQLVFEQTGYAPHCMTSDVEKKEDVQDLVTFVKHVAPDGLDSVILAAARTPDGTDVVNSRKPDGAVRVVLGNLYLATQLIESQALSSSGRVVFVTSRSAIKRISSETSSVLTRQRDYSKTFVFSQSLAALAAAGLRHAYSQVNVGLAVASPVQTTLVREIIESGQASKPLVAELEQAPQGDAAKIASGSALLRALEPGFCADGCGELTCTLPEDAMCMAWSRSRQFVNLKPLDACPFVLHPSFFINAAKKGVCGSIACAINVVLTLPAYNVLDIRVQTGHGLLYAIKTINDAGPGRFYSGFGMAMLFGPLVRFGDTFSHAIAETLFGVNSVMGIMLTAILVCIMYPLWRLLVYLVAFPEKVGMDGKKKAGTAEESPNLKVGALIYATVVAAFPFWVGLDGTTFLLGGHLHHVLIEMIAGAVAGIASCLCSIRGSGLMMRLPLSTFEAVMFSVTWATMCSLLPLEDV
jgi:NAD(P)-dependent dehydrogenase (short-subunit alcohol dehydrogenase family)